MKKTLFLFFVLLSIPLVQGATTIDPGVEFSYGNVIYNVTEQLNATDIWVYDDNLTWDSGVHSRTAASPIYLDLFRNVITFRDANLGSYLSSIGVTITDGDSNTQTLSGSTDAEFIIHEGSYSIAPTKTGYESRSADYSFSAGTESFIFDMFEEGGSVTPEDGGGATGGDEETPTEETPSSGGGSWGVYEGYSIEITSDGKPLITYDPYPLNILVWKVPINKEVIVTIRNNGNKTFRGTLELTGALGEVASGEICDFGLPLSNCQTGEIEIFQNEDKILKFIVTTDYDFIESIEGQVLLRDIESENVYALNVILDRVPGYSIWRWFGGLFEGEDVLPSSSSTPLDNIPVVSSFVSKTSEALNTSKYVVWGLILSLIFIVIFWKWFLVLIANSSKYFVTLVQSGIKLMLGFGIWGFIVVGIAILLIILKFIK